MFKPSYNPIGNSFNRVRPLVFKTPEDIFADESSIARRHVDEIRTPAIDQAIDDWNEARSQGDQQALRAAAKAIVDSTSAAFRIQGVPVFAHPVVPPQFVRAEVGKINGLQDSDRSATVATLLGNFEEGAGLLVKQQFASALADQRGIEGRQSDSSQSLVAGTRQRLASDPPLQGAKNQTIAQPLSSRSVEFQRAEPKPGKSVDERARQQAAENAGRFADYNDGDIAQTVDAVVDSSTWFERRIGNAGKGVNGKGRYIWTRYGWVDLQHVIGAATATIDPVLNELLGLGKETEQYLGGMKSGFKREDLLSNHIGASALAYQQRFGGTIGQAIAHVLAWYRPATSQQATEFLRNGGQAEPWPW